MKDLPKYKDYYAFAEMVTPGTKFTEEIGNLLFEKSGELGFPVYSNVDIIYPDEMGKDSRDAKVHIYHKKVFDAILES